MASEEIDSLKARYFAGELDEEGQGRLLKLLDGAFPDRRPSPGLPKRASDTGPFAPERATARLTADENYVRSLGKEPADVVIALQASDVNDYARRLAERKGGAA